MSQENFTVEYVKPGEHLIEPGSEKVAIETGIDYKAGKLSNGNWIAWVPHWEQPNYVRKGEAVRAIAENEHIAAGAVRKFYEDER